MAFMNHQEKEITEPESLLVTECLLGEFVGDRTQSQKAFGMFARRKSKRERS